MDHPTQVSVTLKITDSCDKNNYVWFQCIWYLPHIVRTSKFAYSCYLWYFLETDNLLTLIWVILSWVISWRLVQHLIRVTVCVVTILCLISASLVAALILPASSPLRCLTSCIISSKSYQVTFWNPGPGIVGRVSSTLFINSAGCCLLVLADLNCRMIADQTCLTVALIVCTVFPQAFIKKLTALQMLKFCRGQ